MKKITQLLSFLMLIMFLQTFAFSHCQIPCGIYDDEARAKGIAEHIKTIEKSIKLIETLSAAENPDYNQIVRWVNNKDKHADELSDIVTYYFMAQRIKPPKESDEEAEKKYNKQLTLLHKMLVYSMKTKQSTDLKNVEELKKLLKDFNESYFGKEKHEHK